MNHYILNNLRHAVRERKNVIIGGGEFKPVEIEEFLTYYEATQDSRAKGWALAKSLQTQVDILLPVVQNAADDDDEYGIGPSARKALEALAAHKET